MDLTDYDLISQIDKARIDAYGRDAATYKQDNDVDPKYIPLYVEEIRKMLESGAHPLPQKVLDLGCGGDYTLQILDCLLGEEAQIIGVDENDEMLEVSKAFAATHHNISIVKLKVDGKIKPEDVQGGGFDLIFARQVICHFTQPQLTFTALRRLLSPQGKLLFIEGFWPKESWMVGHEYGLECPLSVLERYKEAPDAIKSAYFWQKTGFQQVEAKLIQFPESHERMMVCAF